MLMALRSWLVSCSVRFSHGTIVVDTRYLSILLSFASLSYDRPGIVSIMLKRDRLAVSA